MGKTYTIPTFFDADITIVPHSATHARHLGREVTIEQFAQGRPVKLLICDETGELTAQCGQYPDIEFIEGPEHLPALLMVQAD